MISNRLRGYINSLKSKNFIKNDTEFALSIKISPQKLSEILRGKQKIQLEDIQIMIDIYSDLNLYWLITGNGEMNKPITVGFERDERYSILLDRRALDKWNHYTKKLNINKRMYALKHTGAQMYISDNEHVDVSWLQNQMEHSTLSETQTYIAKRTMKHLDENKLKLPKL